MEDDKTFALQEYSALRAEILLRVAASQAMERNVLISAGLVGGFLLIHPPHGWERAAWLLPVLIAIFGCFRSWCDEQQFDMFGKYITLIEKRFPGDGPGPFGWEAFRLLPTVRPKMFGRNMDVSWRTAFWGSFLAVTLAAAICGVWLR